MTQTRSAVGRLWLGIRLSIPFVLVVPIALAETLIGEVVKVQDGDTLTVLVDKTQIRVRLDAIDAPERGQAFATVSRQSLTDICAAKAATVVKRGKDAYGRTIGRVSCAGVDASSEQVRRGMAWVFVKYAPPGSPLYALETAAKGARAGLWAEPKPVAPWEWRARK